MPTPPEPHARKREKHQPAAARRRRLDELKRQIQSGDYETPEKLDLTLSRLLADLRTEAKEPAATPEDDSGGARP